MHVETKSKLVKWGGKKRKNSKKKIVIENECDTLGRNTATSTLSDQGRKDKSGKSSIVHLIRDLGPSPARDGDLVKALR